MESKKRLPAVYLYIQQKKNVTLFHFTGRSATFKKFNGREFLTHLIELFSNPRFSMRSRGGSRIFSRGGGFSKKFPKFWRPFFFFRSTKLIFRALPKHCFAPILAKFSAPQANFWKNSKKKAVFGHFLKNFDKKNCFFLARAPPQS